MRRSLGASDSRSLQSPETPPLAEAAWAFSAMRIWCCMQAARPFADPVRRRCSEAELCALCMHIMCQALTNLFGPHTLLDFKQLLGFQVLSWDIYA